MLELNEESMRVLLIGFQPLIWSRPVMISGLWWIFLVLRKRMSCSIFAMVYCPFLVPSTFSLRREAASPDREIDNNIKHLFSNARNYLLKHSIKVLLQAIDAKQRASCDNFCEFEAVFQVVCTIQQDIPSMKQTSLLRRLKKQLRFPQVP